MKYRYLLWTLAFLGAFATTLYALDVLVDTLSGEVEVKQGSGAWQSAQKGMKLAAGDRVSTGFDSKVILKFEDNSVVTVKSLTQITIDRFLKDETAVRTDVAVRVGEIKAEVERGKGTKSDFVVITPASVVSVRGTDETINSSDIGTRVSVDDGQVRGENQQAVGAQVARTQEAFFPRGNELPVTPTDINIDQARSDTTGNIGLTPQETQIVQQFSDPTTDPGSATEGQEASTAKPAPPPPPPQEDNNH